MKTRCLSIICTLALVLVLASCRQKGSNTHVLLIGLDGWGSYSMQQSDIPTINWLMQNGSYTLKKRTVLPSSSAANWASMFMGASPDVHGYTRGQSRTPDVASYAVYEHNIFPTISQILRQQRPDAEIGCIFDWSGIKYLVDTLACNYVAKAQAPKTADNGALDNSVCQLAEQYIKEKKPTLATIVFDNPDHVGHRAGHDTPEYYAKMHELDGYIARIIQATKDAGIYDDTVFILTADHGGKGIGHGGKTLEEMQIPFIIFGKGIKKAGEFSELMMQFDTAPTIAHILGLQAPQVWHGRPMLQVFK